MNRRLRCLHMSQKKLNGAGYCWKNSGGALREVTCKQTVFEDWAKEGGIDAHQQEVSDVKASDESERQVQIDSGSE